MSRKPRKKPSHLRLATDAGFAPSDESWLVVSFNMPGFVTDEDKPYQAVVIAILDEDGMMLGSNAGHPRKLRETIADVFQMATTAPPIGEPRRPARLLVAADLVHATKGAVHDVEVVQAPKSLADNMSAHLLESFEEYANIGDEGEVSGPDRFLELDLDNEDFDAFFSAMANLYELQPWELLPSSDEAVGVWLEAYGKTFPVCVMGQAGESYGVLIFDDYDEYESYLLAIDDEDIGSLPNAISLNFERGADISDDARKRIAAAGWKVAGPNAYPWPFAYDAEFGPRPPSLEEVVLGTAVIEAVAQALRGRTAADMERALDGEQLGVALRPEGKREPVAWVSAPCFEFPLAHPDVENMAIAYLDAYDEDVVLDQFFDANSVFVNAYQSETGLTTDHVQSLAPFFATMYSLFGSTLRDANEHDVIDTVDSESILAWLPDGQQRQLVDGLLGFFEWLQGKEAFPSACAIHASLKAWIDDEDAVASPKTKKRGRTPAADKPSCEEVLNLPSFQLDDLTGADISKRAWVLALLVEAGGRLRFADVLQGLLDVGAYRNSSDLSKGIGRLGLDRAPFFEEAGDVVLDPYDDEADRLALDLRYVLRPMEQQDVIAPLPDAHTPVDDTARVALDDLAGVFEFLRLSNVRTVMLVLDAMLAVDAGTAVASETVVKWMEEHGVSTDLDKQRKEMRRKDRAVEVLDGDRWYVDVDKHEATLLKIRKEAHGLAVRAREDMAHRAKMDALFADLDARRAVEKEEEERKTRAVMAFYEFEDDIISATVDKHRDIVLTVHADQASVRRHVEAFDVVVGVDIVEFARRMGVSRAKVDLKEFMPKQKTVSSKGKKRLPVTLASLVEGTFVHVGWGDNAPELADTKVIERSLRSGDTQKACDELFKTAEAMFHLAVYADLHFVMWASDPKQKLCHPLRTDGGMGVASMREMAREAYERDEPLYGVYGGPARLRDFRAQMLKMTAAPVGSGFVHKLCAPDGEIVDEDLIMQVLTEEEFRKLGEQPAFVHNDVEGGGSVDVELETENAERRTEAIMMDFLKALKRGRPPDLIPLGMVLDPDVPMARLNINGPPTTGDLAGRRFTFEEAYSPHLDDDIVGLTVVDVETNKVEADFRYEIPPSLGAFDGKVICALDRTKKQGQHANELMKAFASLVGSDPSARQHFAHHNAMVKDAVSDPTHPGASLFESLRYSGFTPQAPVRKDKEPGRNDPCPCGSGKKYKKCCLRKK